MKKGVLTEYKINENKYSSYIIGNDYEDIKIKLYKRNLNEIITSNLMELDNIIKDYSKLDDNTLMLEYSSFLHTICFLSYLCYRSNSIDVENLLNDEGILHEVIHIKDRNCFTNKELEKSRSLFVKLKRNVIGAF
ncbi:hypothetical protein [Myroides odoratus]|uniref:hypothetical protein n=1 Tax=Myroides odoratus TaxID=256 RepID=UPI000765E695|nr:hypothetical protein [Myroides odoratus]